MGRNTRYYAPDVPGWLSLKCMFDGQALYTFDGGRVAVDDAHYLILNDQQQYTIEIASNQMVSSFCIFFPAVWAHDALRTLTIPGDDMLDNPLLTSDQLVLFYENRQHHDSQVTPLAMNIRRRILSGDIDSGWLDEAAYAVLAAMLHTQRQVYREAERLPALRTATRHELYRRLHRGRDTMLSNLGETLTLDELANVAYLSPYHFLRMFKAVFGATPHTYLTQKRLEKARILLDKSSLPVTTICYDVGFHSPGSFSTRFRRTYGLSPRQYRQTMQNG